MDIESTECYYVCNMDIGEIYFSHATPPELGSFTTPPPPALFAKGQPYFIPFVLDPIRGQIEL